MSASKAPEQKAIYWEMLLPHVVPRDREGCFHLTRGRMVIEVVQPVSWEFPTPDGPKVWEANPGDVVVRVRRPANNDEIDLAKALTGVRITHVRIAEIFDDPHALQTALRQTVRQIPKNLLGRTETIRGRRIVIPGSITKATTPPRRQEILGQYAGLMTRAREIRRIQIKIEAGFRTAYQSLVIFYFELTRNPKQLSMIARQLAGLWTYLVRVAAFRPYFDWVHNRPEVQALENAQDVKDQEQLLRLIARAISALEKGWRGIQVQPKEIRNARRRIRSEDEPARGKEGEDNTEGTKTKSRPPR